MNILSFATMLCVSLSVALFSQAGDLPQPTLTISSSIPKSKMLSIITVSELATQYELPEWMDRNNRLLIHKGDANIAGNLYLDWDRGWRNGDILKQWAEWNNLPIPGEEEIDGVLITGNLSVSGSVINADGDGGPALLVMGNLSAQSLVSGGAYIDIRGNATLTEAVYGHYNDGVLNIWGKVIAPIYINDDHSMSVGMNTFLKTGSFSKSDYDTQVYMNVRELSQELYSDDPIPQPLRKLVSPQLQKWSEILSSLCEGASIMNPSK
jgi:hypothetical protein